MLDVAHVMHYGGVWLGCGKPAYGCGLSVVEKRLWPVCCGNIVGRSANWLLDWLIMAFDSILSHDSIS